MNNQQTQIPMPPMICVADAWFCPLTINGIDPFNYTPGDKEREIVLILAGGEIVFRAERADVFKLWWDQLTGQARIQPAPTGIKLA